MLSAFNVSDLDHQLNQLHMSEQNFTKLLFLSFFLFLSPLKLCLRRKDQIMKTRQI